MVMFWKSDIETSDNNIHEFIYSFIFNNNFTQLRAMVDSEPILPWLEYQSITVHYMKYCMEMFAFTLKVYALKM